MSGAPLTVDRTDASALRIEVAAGEPIALRGATSADARAVHALIVAHLAEGHLLPRDPAEIARHAHRFVVAVHADHVVGCAELAPLSRDTSEVRSLVVGRGARRLGVGRQIVDALIRRARVEGFGTLCAFAHAPGFFVHRGFSIVPHVWLPEKIVTDCHACVHFRRCGQYALVKALRRPGSAPRGPAAPHA